MPDLDNLILNNTWASSSNFTYRS